MTEIMTAHRPWCADKDDDGPAHECNASLHVDLSRYPLEPQPLGYDWQRTAGVLLSLDSGGEAYVQLGIGEDRGQGADLTVAEAAQLAAALSYVVAKAGAV